ncbi:MAG: efflux RND transporter permease subunit [Parachlamydiaceae bacterium]|nr:efflux RND transporter permease subunit [Parachlamydiaceae bacterium]
MNISEPFIRRPVMTALLTLALVIAGFLAFFQLPVSDLPNIEYPRITVEASYAGASPETMVNTVTKPLEKELVNVSGVKEMSSRSSRGSSVIHLDFDLGKNVDDATREVQSAISRAESSLPADITQRPYYYKKEASQGHIAYLLLTSSNESTANLREYADIFIEQRLARIEGVAGVEVFGAPYAIKIYVNPDLMAARNVSVDQLINAIKQQNADLPLGIIETDAKKLSIELNGLLQNVKDFEELIVADGPVRLKDIATVSDQGNDTGEFHYITKDVNQIALTIGVQKMSSGNTVAISKAIQKALPEIIQNLPPSMDLKLWFDKAVWIQESIVDVQWSLGIAFFLVVGVIYLCLGRLSEALIPSVALPMSLLGTFVAMYWLNFSLDILSMLALTLSIGFVVDDAIVVVENIVRHNTKGLSILEASLKGSKEICFTIVSMTLSLVVVFTPLLLMGGMHGRLFHEFSMTLAIAILISGAVSLTLTPMLCSRWLPSHDHQTRLQNVATAVNTNFVRWYGKSLKWALKFPKSILAGACFCFVCAIPLFNHLTVDLFPKEDRGFMYSIVHLSQGLSAERTREYQSKIEKIIQANPAVESFIDLSQESSQIFVVRLLPHSQRLPQEQVIEQIQNGIDAIPGTRAFTLAWQLINVDLDIANGGDYKYQMRGLDPQELKVAADSLLAKMQGNSDFTFARLDQQQDTPKLAVKMNEENVWKQGFSLLEIQSLLQKVFSGATVTHLQKNGQRYKVSLALDRSFGKSVNALENLYLHRADGTPVPLKAIASWEEKLGSPSIKRIDQLPTISLNFAINKSLPPNEGIQKLEILADEALSQGVKGRLQGSAAMIASALQETGLLLLFSAIAMYIVLGMLYESFIHPITILSSLPFAGLGGVLTLLLFDEPLSIYSVVGFLLLIGIVKKNGIMVVDFAIEMRKDLSISPEKAIYESCLVRFRPIIMTTVAAIMGALPIAFGLGEGADSRRGLGLVIVGGLLFSQLLILYVTPVIYLLLERRSVACCETQHALAR